MKHVFFTLLLLSMLLFNGNSAYSFNNGYPQNTEPYKEEVKELHKGSLPKTRSLIKYVEVLNYTTHLTVIFNTYIETANLTLTDISGKILYSDTVDSNTQPIVDFSLQFPKGSYMLYIASTSGYQAYSIIVIK